MVLRKCPTPRVGHVGNAVVSGPPVTVLKTITDTTSIGSRDTIRLNVPLLEGALRLSEAWIDDELLSMYKT